jgi:schlafen family protein
MRKYVLALLLIATGFLLLIYISSQKNKSSYSEALFSTESKNFDQSFSKFVNSVKKNIDTLKFTYNDYTKIKDTLYTQHFLLDFIDNDPYLNSVVLIQNNYKAAAIKDDKSIIFTIDSLENQQIVRWQRFENKSLISSWKESFERPINKTQWYYDLNKKKDQIQWLFNINLNEEDKSNSFIYAGYSFETNKVLNTILLRFSREKILNLLSLNYENTIIKIESLQGNQLNFEKGNSIVSNRFVNTEPFNDSLNIKSHFKKFNNEKSGTFNFSFNNEVYWNSFKRYSTDTGILYYLITIPNKDLQINTAGNMLDSLKWLAIVIIAIGLIVLLIKKRFFYKFNRIKIPLVNKLLKEDENRYLEFKSSYRWDYRQEKPNPELEKVVLKTISAFGNTDGGILILGVDDNKNILGLEKDFNTLKKSTADYYEIHLRNVLHNFMGVKYVSKHIRIQFEKYQDHKEICKIKVIAADEPLYLKYKNKNGQIEEKFYVRSGNSSQEIKSIADINDYINSRFK